MKSFSNHNIAFKQKAYTSQIIKIFFFPKEVSSVLFFNLSHSSNGDALRCFFKTEQPNNNTTTKQQDKTEAVIVLEV